MARDRRLWAGLSGRGGEGQSGDALTTSVQTEDGCGHEPQQHPRKEAP